MTVDWTAVAAWVQAIGAIIALIVAVGLPIQQQRSNHEKMGEILAEIGEEALARLDQMIALAQHRPVQIEMLPSLRLGELTGLLSRIPLEQLLPKQIKIALQMTAICYRLTDHWNNDIETKMKQRTQVNLKPLTYGKMRLVDLIKKLRCQP